MHFTLKFSITVFIALFYISCGNGSHSQIQSFGSRSFSPIESSRVKGLELGVNYSCAIVDKEVICWGDLNNDLLMSKPSFNNPLELRFWSSVACAIDGDEVKCWDKNGPITVPTLQKPKRLANHLGRYCAIDELGLRCWTKDGDDKGYQVGFENVVMAEFYRELGCTLDSQGSVVCEGSDFADALEVPMLNSPSKIAVGWRFACAKVPNDLVCWGHNRLGQAEPPMMTNIIDFDVNGSSACAISDNRIRCWGELGYYWDYPQQMTNPALIKVAPYHACALGDDGVLCWGRNSSGETTVPYF